MSKAKKIEQIKKKLDEAVQKREKLIEHSIKSTRISALLENNLEQAELIFAAKDIQDKLQRIAGDLAKMQADVLPIADNIKGSFGPELSATWEKTTTDSLLDSLNVIRKSKDAIGNAILSLEGKEVQEIDNDMSSFEDGDELDLSVDVEDDSEIAVDDTEDGDENDEDVEEDDLFGAAEPLGRAQKESRSFNKSALVESVNRSLSQIRTLNKTIKESKSVARKDNLRNKVKVIRESLNNEVLGSYRKIGTILLMTESVDSLVKWLNENVTSSMPADKKEKLMADVAAAKNSNPVDLAGWIGQKKYGAGLSAQLFNPLANLNPSDLTEDTQTVKPVSPLKPLNTNDKKEAGGVMAKISASMATDKNLANKPMTAATASMTPAERNTVKKIQNTIKSTGKTGDKVSDFITNSEPLLQESHYRDVLSDVAVREATLSENEEDYNDPLKVDNVYFTYMTPAGKFGHREFKAMNRAQRESYKLVANGCQIDEVRITRKESLNPVLSEDNSDITDKLDIFENPENVSDINITYSTKVGREGSKEFSDINKARKWFKEALEKGYEINGVTASNTYVSERNCTEDMLKSKKVALEKALAKMEENDTDESLKSKYYNRLATVTERISECGPEVSEAVAQKSDKTDETAKFTDTEFQKVADWAIKRSRKGKTTYVNAVGKSYEGSEFYNKKKTVATFEKGKQVEGPMWLEAKKEKGKKLEEASNFSSKSFEEAAKWALEDSKNGYVQHVDKVGGVFVVDDWMSDDTVASFENGRQIGGSMEF